MEKADPFQSILRILNLGILCLISLFTLSGETGNFCSGRMLMENQTAPGTHVRDSGLLRYDVKHYGICLEINDTSTYLEGYTEVLAQALEPVSELVFEFNSGLFVDSILLGGEKVAFWSHDSDLIRIPVEPALDGSSLFSTRVYYRGTSGKEGFFSGISNRTDPMWGSRVTYTLSESFQARDWFVCKQVLNDKADSADVWLIVDEGLLAGSNGILDGIDSLPGKKVRFRWKTRYPVAYYLISLAVADYQDYSFYAHSSNLQDSLLIQNYIYDVPGCLEANLEDIRATAELIDLYSGLYGPYPFQKEKYGHCLAPLGGGMEHQTMTTLSGFRFTLVAHELAHQWFGDRVTCASWQDIWINEGFASYTEYLALENLKSADEARIWMNQAHELALSSPFGSVYIPEEEADDEYRIFSLPLSYKKGAALLHMIRYELGEDSLFFSVLDAFQEKFADSVATGADFLQVLNEVSGSDYSWFFDQWYYGQGYPRFEFTWWQSADSVYVEIRQSGSSEKTPFFRTRLDIDLFNEDGADTVLQLVCDEPYSKVGIKVDHTVDGLIPDPGNWVLEESQVIWKVPFSGTLRVTPNPFTDELNLTFQSRNASRNIILSDISGKVLENYHSAEATVTLNTQNLSQGIYLIRVLEGEKTYSARVIKQ